MAVFQKSHFKLGGYLNFRLGHSVNLILNLEKFRNHFAKFRNFMLRNNKKPIEQFKHLIDAQRAFEMD